MALGSDLGREFGAAGGLASAPSAHSTEASDRNGDDIPRLRYLKCTINSVSNE